MGRPRTWLIAAGLLVLLAVAGYFLGRSYYAQHHFESGKQALDNREAEAALDHFETSLRLGSPDVEIHLLAARAARLVAKYDRAEHHLDVCKTLESKPGSAVVLELALLEVQRRGLTPDYEFFLRQRLDTESREARYIHEVLAPAYLDSYRLGDALDSIRRWLQLEPNNVDALTLRGDVFRQLARDKEALDDYRRGVRLDPDNPEPRSRLATLLLTSAPKEALAHFEKLHEQLPNHPAIQGGLAEAYLAVNDPRARQFLDRWLSKRPKDAHAHRQRGELALNQEDYETAERHLREAEQLDPYNFRVLFLLQQTLSARGKDDEAEALTSRAEELKKATVEYDELAKKAQEDASNLELRMKVARLCAKYGRGDEARRWLQGILLIDPDYEPARQALGGASNR